MFVHDPLYPPEIKLPDDLMVILLGLSRAMNPLLESDGLIMRVVFRITLAMNALVFVFHRWHESLLRPARKQPQRQPAKAPAKNQPPVRRRPMVVLPRRFGWLPQYLPETAIFAEQLQQFLADPEAADLFARCPQAGKILRPICRMLGVKPIPELLRRKSPNQSPNQAPTPALPPLPTAPPENRPQHPPTATIQPAPLPPALNNNDAAPPPRVFEVKT